MAPRWPQDGPKRAPKSILRNLPDARRPLLGPSWAILGSSWGISWPSWGHLGAIFGHLGATFGSSWCHLGASCGHLVAILGHRVDILRPCWAIFGAFLGSKCRLWGHIGVKAACAHQDAHARAQVQALSTCMQQGLLPPRPPPSKNRPPKSLS